VPDIVDPATRSRMMAGIRATNTKPEMLVRKALHRLGFRYGLHCRDVPGKPDLVFRSRRAVIFVHGCFWHGHDCKYFRLPSTRPEFWRNKIARNQARDAVVAAQLKAERWRRLIIWECAIRGQTPPNIANVISRTARWLDGTGRNVEIRGKRASA
jgi:DNA mismatch endonuclease (patch repair protein)